MTSKTPDTVAIVKEYTCRQGVALATQARRAEWEPRVNRHDTPWSGQGERALHREREASAGGRGTRFRSSGGARSVKSRPLNFVLDRKSAGVAVPAPELVAGSGRRA